MPNAHNHTSANNNESSVLFNLQELMRIEHERVLADAAAQEAMERERMEHERRCADDAARAQAEAVLAQRDMELARQRSATDAETARATALLKVQLEVEAIERAERQRLEREHARALSLIEAERHGHSSGNANMWLLFGTLLLAALGYFAVLSPLLQESRAREVAALELALKHAREISTLRDRAVSPLTPAQQPVAANVDITDLPSQSTVEKPKRKGGARAKVVRQQDTRDEVDVLDSDDDDPLRGL